MAKQAHKLKDTEEHNKVLIKVMTKSNFTLVQKTLKISKKMTLNKYIEKITTKIIKEIIQEIENNI